MSVLRFSFLIGVSFMLLSCRNSEADKKSDLMSAYPQMINTYVATKHGLVSMFPKDVATIQAWMQAGMQMAREELDQLLSILAHDRTFENTARFLDTSQNKLSRVAGVISLASMVSPDQAIREAAHNASTQIDQFSVDLYFNPAIYKAFQDYLEHQGREESLSEESRYYLQEAMRDFKREGFNLPEEKLAQVKGLKKEIAKLSNDFSLNIATDLKSIKVSLEDLEGVSSDVITGLKRDGDLYILGIDYPTYFEVMEKCQVAKTRKSLYIAFNNRAYPNNEELLKQLFTKRDEIARVLGYKNFASFDIDNTMAKSEERVESFLFDLIKVSSKKAVQELALLNSDLPEGLSLNAEGLLNPWDYSFVREYYKKKHFNIDESAIAEYFPVQKALDGMFSIYQEFLGLTFKEVKPEWSWHEEVRLIEIYRKDSDEFLGYLFLDLYPRDNKYTHACYVPLVPSFKPKGNSIPSVGVVIANFPKPNGGKPALLKHSDVETFFHEFGHAMHGVLGRTELAVFSGTSVKTDYVEMPSQMFEEWMIEADMLERVSSHYKTGQPLPIAMINKKIELKKFDSGYFVLRQAMLSLLSLGLSQADERAIDPAGLWQELNKTYMASMMSFEPEAHFYASFGHLGSAGYAAKYYSYMWSKVFALDIFAAVKKQGLLDHNVGQKVAQGLLGKGGSVDPDALLYAFLGREPNQKAFLHELGLE